MNVFREHERPLLTTLSAVLVLTGCGSSHSPNASLIGGIIGDPRFATAQDYPAELLTSFGSASTIDTADFNRDGHPDLVIGNTGEGR